MMKEKKAITSGGGGGGGGLEDGIDILRRLETGTALPERVITDVVFVRARVVSADEGIDEVRAEDEKNIGRSVNGKLMISLISGLLMMGIVTLLI